MLKYTKAFLTNSNRWLKDEISDIEFFRLINNYPGASSCCIYSDTWTCLNCPIKNPHISTCSMGSFIFELTQHIRLGGESKEYVLLLYELVNRIETSMDQLEHIAIHVRREPGRFIAEVADGD